MLHLRVVQARYGDCLILECGYGKRRRYVLIDGGPTLVYKPYLRAELSKIAQSGGKISLMVLTHVDNDHVVGLLEFIQELKAASQANQAPLIEVMGMWHNGFSKFLTDDPVEAEKLEEQMLTVPLEDTTPAGDSVTKSAQAGGADLPVLDEAWLMDNSFGIKEGHSLQAAQDELSIVRNYGFPRPPGARGRRAAPGAGSRDAHLGAGAAESQSGTAAGFVGALAHQRGLILWGGGRKLPRTTARPT